MQSDLGRAALAAAAAVLAVSSCDSEETRPAAHDDVVRFADIPAPPGQDITGNVEAYAPLRPVIEELPAQVVVGERFRFVVALENPTDTNIPLDPCPAYFFSFGMDGLGPLKTGTLNCADAPAAIPAHGRLRFEMKGSVQPEDRLKDGMGAEVIWRLTSAPHGNMAKSGEAVVKAANR